jgi:hypothetical protein
MNADIKSWEEMRREFEEIGADIKRATLAPFKKSEMLTKRELFAKDILCAMITSGDKTLDLYKQAISRADAMLKQLNES